MIVKFTTPTQPAGSLGGLVLYKNGSQLAGRSRSYPTRVRSNEHTAVMSIIGELSMNWEIQLTGADRLGWGNYAFNTPLTDAYGVPRYIVGYAQYMRSNRPRLQQGLPRIDLPPVTFGIPAYTLPTFVMPTPNITVSVSFSTADTWANQDGAAMLLWMSRPISPTRVRPPEVYRPIGVILGNSTTPPTSPAVFATPSWIPAANVAAWIRSSITLADGRLSGQ